MPFLWQDEEVYASMKLVSGLGVFLLVDFFFFPWMTCNYNLADTFQVTLSDSPSLSGKFEGTE